MKEMSIKNLLNQATFVLRNNSTTPHLDAELLLCHVLQQDRTYLFSHHDLVLTQTQHQQWQRLIAKRQQQIPIAYLLGQKEFWNLQLQVNEHTLIPRPETELLVELILSLCRGEYFSSALATRLELVRCLDLGTGSGAIALALAKEHPHWHITATDISLQALRVAQSNAEKNSIHNVTFVHSDWLSNVHGKFDIIVSNPPYLDKQDPHLIYEEIRYEPRSALVADNNGLADIEKIIADARDYLKSGGYLLIEHGCAQGGSLKALFESYNYASIETVQDLQGLDRVTRASFI